MRNDPTLDSLVEAGDISEYEYLYRNEDGEIVPEQNGMRGTEELVITFPSGRRLVLDTFCSGSAQNTVLTASQGASVPRKLEYPDALALSTTIFILLTIWLVRGRYADFGFVLSLLLGWIPGFLYVWHHNKKRLEHLV